MSTIFVIEEEEALAERLEKSLKKEIEQEREQQKQREEGMIQAPPPPKP